MLVLYNPDYHTPGKNIRQLRRKYALSRRALAKLLGISDIHLKRIEEGQTPPEMDIRILCRLSRIFDLPEGKDICSPDLLN